MIAVCVPGLQEAERQSLGTAVTSWTNGQANKHHAVYITTPYIHMYEYLIAKEYCFLSP